MKTLAILVEGPRDEAVYPALIKQIRPDLETVLPLVYWGLPRLRKRFVEGLWYFDNHWEHKVEKALVIRDSDGGDPKSKEDELAEIYTHSGFHPKFDVHFHATPCMIETWLLADEGAVCRVARGRGKTPKVMSINKALEEIKDAKAPFRRMLSQAGLLDDNQVCKEIAEAADLGRISERCPYFRKFCERVHAC